MAKTEISYNKNLKELDEILNEIENSDIDLDQLTTKVKRATFLLKECKTNLRDTSKLIENIIEDWEE
ncbi:MAG: exodeoxyribonuclease VII small subunit [Bacteroidales bacterium]|jgi:exodeoxyribonuclease VII small subunit|nr:exodeoxyribonuclease VII small subunit [Bacteroidales bacterium]